MTIGTVVTDYELEYCTIDYNTLRGVRVLLPAPPSSWCGRACSRDGSHGYRMGVLTFERLEGLRGRSGRRYVVEGCVFVRFPPSIFMYIYICITVDSFIPSLTLYRFLNIVCIGYLERCSRMILFHTIVPVYFLLLLYVGTFAESRSFVAHSDEDSAQYGIKFDGSFENHDDLFRQAEKFHREKRKFQKLENRRLEGVNDEQFDDFVAHKDTMTCTADEHVTPFNQQVRGVCLGGWQVLEPWITPSLFYQFLGKNSTTTAIDTYTFCEVLGPEEGNKQLRRHWDAW